MLLSPSNIPEKDRAAIARALNELLACTADLQSMAKVAHWNVRGPNFKALHLLFDEVAGVASGQVDEVAERIVALGGYARGTLKQAAAASMLNAYPDNLTKGEEHVRALLSRLADHVVLVKAACKACETHGDMDTVNMLQGFVTEAEKYGWQLAASLG